MNNKGAIFSGYMYVLLVFFLLSLSTLLVVLNNSKKVSNKAREGAENIIENDTTEFNLSLNGNTTVCINLGQTYSDLGVVSKDSMGNDVPVTIVSDLNINQIGEYTVTYTAKDKGKEKSIERKVRVIKNDYVYMGASEEITFYCDGYYQVELWGSDHSNGLGGYTKGVINLKSNEKLYLFVGQLSTVGNATAFNGGTGSSGGYPGGGATDVRLLNKTWNDLESLKSRIMIAGGAGSGNVQYSHGGGLIGQKSGGATAGTQTAPGVNQSVSYLAPSFGIGGGGCGGGGGYYGAGGATCVDGGAGGSGFVSGLAGVNAITNDLTITHTNNTLHYSGKYFIDSIIETGKVEPDRLTASSGKAKITYIGTEYPKTNTSLESVRYVKSCTNGNSVNVYNSWVELQVIKDGVNLALGKTPTGTSPEASELESYSFIVDGMIDNSTWTTGYGRSSLNGNQCVTIDLGKVYDVDEIAVWHYFNDGRTYTDKVVSVSSDNVSWAGVIIGTGAETPNGSRVNAWN